MELEKEVQSTSNCMMFSNCMMIFPALTFFIGSNYSTTVHQIVRSVIKAKAYKIAQKSSKSKINNQKPPADVWCRAWGGTAGRCPPCAPVRWPPASCPHHQTCSPPGSSAPSQGRTAQHTTSTRNKTPKLESQ